MSGTAGRWREHEREPDARAGAGVSWIIPCYDEEAALEPFSALLAGLPADELVFVDDGSRDGTAARLESFAAADARVRVVTHATNRGVGAAVRSGLLAARGAVCVVVDADRTYPLDDVGVLVASVRGHADVASASPLSLGGASTHVPWQRRLLTRGAAWAYRLVLGRCARDVATFTCAFRAYRREALALCLPQGDGFEAAAEMLGRALLGGLCVVEHPSTLRGRTEGHSKLRLGRALAGHALTLARLLRLRLGPRRVTPR